MSCNNFFNNNYEFLIKNRVFYNVVVSEKEKKDVYSDFAS